MKLAWEQHGARIRRPPENRLIVVVPGENAMPIGFEETFRTEVAAYGQQAFGRRLLNWWKAKILPV
jgi:hypothetical protein